MVVHDARGYRQAEPGAAVSGQAAAIELSGHVPDFVRRYPAAAVAVRLAKDPKNSGKTIVVVLPDSGERYLTSVLYEGLFND